MSSEARHNKLNEKEIIRECTTIKGCSEFGFEEDIFKHDYWSAEQGISYLAGVLYFKVRKDLGNYVELMTLSKEPYNTKLHADVIKEFEREIQRLWNIWSSGEHDNLNPPNYYIEWALSKKINIHWLEYAIEEGLIEGIDKNLLLGKKLNQKELFDKNSPTYPPELDIAIQAWNAVKDDTGKRKPKAKVRDWLDANTQLSNEAKERISIVVNWDKLGGATRTD